MLRLGKLDSKLVVFLIKLAIVIVLFFALYNLFISTQEFSNVTVKSHIEKGYVFKVPNYDKVVRTKNLDFYVDTKTLALKIYDRRSNFTWKSVIESEDNDINETWNMFFNSSITIEFFDETGNIRRIYSSRDANIKIKEINGSRLRVNMTFNDIASLDIALTFGDEYFDIRVDKILEGPYKLMSLYTYPFLGGSKGLVDGKYILADGVGALIDLSKVNTATAPFKMRVYGEDEGVKEVLPYSYYRNIKSAENYAIPMYGVLYANNGMLAIIKDKDLYSEINAYKSNIMTPYNWITNRFILRDLHKRLLNKEGQGITIPQERINTLNPTMRYYFVTNANEYKLARKFVEDNKAVQKIFDSKPLLKFDILMAEAKKTSFGYNLVKMTTQRQLEEIQKELLANSVEGIFVLRGYTKGGYSISSPVHLPFERSVIASPSELSRYYFYVDYVTAPKESKSLSKPLIAQNKLEQLMEQYGKYILNDKVVNIARSEKNKFLKYGINKFALGSIGFWLYSTKDSERLDTLSAYSKIMENFKDSIIFGNNWYVVKYAHFLSDVSMENSGYEIEDDLIPIVPYILRQFRIIFSNPVNLSSDYRLQVLKCVEYGVLPSFYLTWNSSKELIETNSKDLFSTKFEDWKDNIIDSCNIIKNAYKITQGSPVSSRTKVLDNVYLVEYENGAKLIFNYNKEPAKIGTTEIEPESFIEVKNYENAFENTRSN
ncbi:MAG: DUF5696 domain-containing protein [Fervidobacterium sp.]